LKITLSVADVNVDVHGITSRVNNDPAFWTFAATEWHRLYEPYVPMQTGMLKDTVSIRPKEIEHTVIYARYQYNGTGFNFRRDMHPKASAKWDQAAAPTQLPKLASSLQAYIDSGRLKLD
jgi:hypothetical protein